MEEALVKRIMPNSLEAEQSVIGSMIMDKEAIMTAGEILIEEDFYHKQYGICLLYTSRCSKGLKRGSVYE